MIDIVRLDVKPTGSDVDMNELEQKLRSLHIDGLKWGSSQLEDVCYGIKKLVIDVNINHNLREDHIIKLIKLNDEGVQNVDVVSRHKY